jgi:flagellar basal-body rod protein FlgF/flagellar basal-body rod protein FlgG
MARTQALDLAANNLANLKTTGYKAHREFYSSLVAQWGASVLSPLNRAINNFGVLGGATVDLRPGSLEPTGNDLDLAIEGPGFFLAQTPAGLRYTRNGSLRLGPEGQLLTAGGDPVLGERGPITVSPGAVSVSSDGTVSVSGAVVGRLRIVEFPPSTALVPKGDSYFEAPEDAGRPAADSQLRQGFLEASNLNPVAGAVGLITLQRQAETMQRALSIFHSEFNRTAVEDLPRV